MARQQYNWDPNLRWFGYPGALDAVMCVHMVDFDLFTSSTLRVKAFGSFKIISGTTGTSAIECRIGGVTGASYLTADGTVVLSVGGLPSSPTTSNDIDGTVKYFTEEATFANPGGIQKVILASRDVELYRQRWALIIEDVDA